MSILLCLGLSFTYYIVLSLCKKIKIKISSDRYIYIWAAIVGIIGVLYEYSFARTELLFPTAFSSLKDIAFIVGTAIILARFSGYQSGSKRDHFNFIIIFPVFEEILFRGTILAILLRTSFLSEISASVMCGLLFGIMHFQYFGINRNAIRKVLIAILGGYFFSVITIEYNSIIPTILIHMIFNFSAILFAKKCTQNYD